jgi:hypothetical protein
LHLEPVDAGHTQIRDDDVEGLLAEPRQTGLRIHEALHRETGAAEDAVQQRSHLRLVVDDEDSPVHIAGRAWHGRSRPSTKSDRVGRRGRAWGALGRA